MTLSSRQDAALEPVRTALRRQASIQAARTAAEATRAAAALLNQARADADSIVARAAADGEAEAEPVAAAELNRSKQAARSIALETDEATRQYLAGRIRSGVLALRHRTDYPLLRQRLADISREAAGTGAVVTEHSDGGVIATARGVMVDCSLGRLADRAIEVLEPRIAELCIFSPPHRQGGSP